MITGTLFADLPPTVAVKRMAWKGSERI